MPIPDASGSRLRRESFLLDEPLPVYCDLLEPEDRAPVATAVLVHGGAHTGACYLHTVDGRPGWAHRFAAAGYRVAVPDWPGVGRSGHIPDDALSGATICRGLGALIERLPHPLIVVTHSMSGAYGWKLLETHGEAIDTLVGVAPGPPGNIQPEPIVFKEDDDRILLQSLELRFTLSRTDPFVASSDFVTRKLVGDSRHFPRERVEAYTRTLLPIPAPLIWERLNVYGRQLRIEDPSTLVGKPILVITGTEDIDHPRDVDGNTAGWLNDNGARAKFLYLGDHGIIGNGHMLMLERNSDAIADVILDWLANAAQFND